MVLRLLSFIVQGLVIQFGLRLASRGRAGFLWLPLEAMERRAEILKHGREVASECGPAADQHIITVRPH
jgi:hypothetical protein